MWPVNVHFFLDTPLTDSPKRGLSLRLDENATYEDIIQMLIQRQFLQPLNSQFYYTLFLTRASHYDHTLHAFLRAGQTLASIKLFMHVPELFCYISINRNYSEINASPLPRKEPSSSSLDWGDLVSKVFDKIAGGASIIALLDAVERRWRERSTTNDAHSYQVASRSSETDIVAIRLRMTHGPDHEFEEWLTEPDKLKHYIDVFNQPGTTILPLKVVFVQRNGTGLPVDVLKGTQNNPQLDELLSYLHIDETDKDVAKRKAKSWRIHFIFSQSVAGKPVPSNRELWATIYDLNITYEELIEFLIQKKHFLLPLDPPSRYMLSLKGIVNDELSFGPTTLKEGQTILNNIHNVHFADSSNYPNFHYECNISIEMETSPLPKEK
jgi:hypothetical protein